MSQHLGPIDTCPVEGVVREHVDVVPANLPAVSIDYRGSLTFCVKKYCNPADRKIWGSWLA